VIDLHTHLLPGVDDGSQSPEQSLAVLRKFAEQGVTAVACTPHLKASEFDDAPCAELDEMLDELRKRAPASPRLVRGFEILIDVPDPEFGEPCLNLAGTRYALVEFGRLMPADASVETLERIVKRGVVPVLAHPERYAVCSVDLARRWRAAGARLQLDATTLAADSRRALRARSLLEAGLGDLVASDNHGDNRSMLAAVEWLERHGGEVQAGVLAIENPRRILADEPTVPVSPMRARRSWYSSLKAFVVGGEE
jgi:protein-tyrosine phosphatase